MSAANPDGIKVDLLLRARRVINPDRGLDGPGVVAISGARILYSGPEVALAPLRAVDLGDAVLLPGLIDLHGHPDRRGSERGSKYGVDPDAEFLPRGVTTVLSQGDAGAADWDDYARATIEPSRTRIRMALNLGVRGEAMPGPALEAGDVDVDAAARGAASDTKDGRIWGIALNSSRAVTGSNDPRRVLSQGLEAAERAGVPLLFGSRREADVSLDEQVALLRRGDLFTYCYSGTPENILDDRTGHVRDSVRHARERGVVFDVGHGMASFDFRIAEAAIADGFPPDTISTDQYRRHVGSRPQHDLPRTLSKLIAAGLPETDAFRAVTSRPAAVLGLDREIGTLDAGSVADVVALRWDPDALAHVDTSGASRPGGCWEAVLVIRDGVIVHEAEAVGS